MNINLCEKIVNYYKNKIENDEKFNKRVNNEEKDAYRVMNAINSSAQTVTIKGIADLARLLNVSKQLTLTGGRNIFEEFCSTAQVEEIIKNMEEKNPKETQFILNFETSECSEKETPFEKEHEQVELYRTIISDEMYSGILKKVNSIIASGKHVPIKTSAQNESELSEVNKSIIAISKIIMRQNGLVPSSELQFAEEKVTLNYADAEKEFGGSVIKEEAER